MSEPDRRATIAEVPPTAVPPLDIPTPFPTATPYQVPANLENVPVTGIAMEFRRVSPADNPQGVVSGSSEHAFLVISRENGFKQVLALDPVGDPMSGKAQGTFIAGNESRADIAHPTHSFALTAPHYPGLSESESLTRYGNDLVAGAKAYNEHPVRYDIPASEGWNSNSWAGSLVIAKGGAAGLADVEKIAKAMDPNLPFLHESATGKAPWKPGDDGREIANVIAADHAGRPIAPGLHNPTIPADRFDPGPVTDHVAAYAGPKESFVSSAFVKLKDDGFKAPEQNAMTFGLLKAQEAIQAVEERVDQIVHPAQTAPQELPGQHGDLPAFEQRAPGEPIHVFRNGVDGEFRAGGYAQAGRITAINGDDVTQHTGRGMATYSLQELLGQSKDPQATYDALRESLTNQTMAEISYRRDGIVQAVDLGQGLSKDQGQSR